MAKGGRRQSVVDRKLEKKVSFKNFFSLLPKEKKCEVKDLLWWWWCSIEI